ncbi:hypothetical protein [Arthrobacter sp. YN]|nr:hypothetical protein [Arthrobacter sp. YN]
MNGLIFLNAILALGFLLAIPWAIRADHADVHLMHRAGSGCRDCEDLS